MPGQQVKTTPVSGVMRQRDKELRILRVRFIAGDAQAEQLASLARLSHEFGRGIVHLTTRQGAEIPFIPVEKIEAATAAVQAAGLLFGADGPRVRSIVACPGQTVCRWGLIDTKAGAQQLDQTFFSQSVPHKLKISITGCPHNCAKATENDIGVMGVILPQWEAPSCNDCKACLKICPVGAIKRQEGLYSYDAALCLSCGHCVGACPTKAWKAEKQGYRVFVGGTMGKRPRLAEILTPLEPDMNVVMGQIQTVLDFYRQEGKAKERLGHLMDRLGLEQSLQQLRGL